MFIFCGELVLVKSSTNNQTIVFINFNLITVFKHTVFKYDSCLINSILNLTRLLI